MPSPERSSVHYHMKQIHFARHILKLDGANASLIAKRVGRSPATVRKWMREGIPKSAEADCLKALKRSGIGRQASGISKKTDFRHRASGISKKGSRSSVISQKGPKSRQSSVVGQKKPKSSDRKPKTENRKRPIPKKSARVPPKAIGGKPKSAVGSRPSAVSSRQSAISKKPISVRKPKAKVLRPAISGRKPKAERLPPTWVEGTFVPLTDREKAEQKQQVILAKREIKRIYEIIEHRKVLRLADQVRTSGVNGMLRVFRLHGKNKNQRKTLYEMIDNEDEAWIKFLEMCEELGMSNAEIRSSWFSPK